MKNITFAGLVSGALAIATIGLAAPALADNAAQPAPAPVQQHGVIGSADPYLPYGTNPSVPVGVWAQS